MEQDAPKKIAFIINSFAGGGAERILGYVVNSIERKRYSPHLCLLLPEQGYELTADVPVTVLAIGALPFYLKATLSALSALAALPFIYSPSRCAKTYRHSKQVLEQLIGSSLALKDFIARERPAALVVFLQTSIVITLLTLVLFRFQLPVACSDRILLSHELKSYRFPLFNRLLMKLLYRRIDSYIAVSEGVKQDMTSQFGLLPGKITTIYNGFDQDLVLRRSSEQLTSAEQELFSQGGLTLITVGRLTEQKGHEYLLQAMAVLRQTVRCRLILVGEGDRLAGLQELARQLGISDLIAYVGWTDNPFKLVAVADVFVLSSRYEGFPNVLLEAMALGKPVVSTDCPSGPGEILENGRYGLLVPPCDPHSLAEALRVVCTDDLLRRRLGQLSRERAASFTLERMVDAYQVTLDSLSRDPSVCKPEARRGA